MHESFHALNEVKQEKIINAAMKVFSQKPYGKACTDDIAAIAEISKGSLFYHFKNKRDLYSYLYEYCCKEIYKKIDEQKVMEETDFFKQNQKAVKARICAMIEHPYIYEFGIRAYYETDKEVATDIKSINQKNLKDINIHFNNNIDISKFRNIEDVNRAVKLLVWLSEGLLKDVEKAGELDLNELQDEFNEYMKVLKRGFYKQKE